MLTKTFGITQGNDKREETQQQSRTENIIIREKVTWAAVMHEQKTELWNFKDGHNRRESKYKTRMRR